jgi:hypothetical protein
MYVDEIASLNKKLSIYERQKSGKPHKNAELADEGEKEND